jgi:hypothetical protein
MYSRLSQVRDLGFTAINGNEAIEWLERRGMEIIWFFWISFAALMDWKRLKR